ncbi:MAG: hypothetical protein JWM34_4430 [Ilumatobacteraceae bacterium]|nr:hypothetical protein [Ilumatobacteraceae bacterium]
MPVVPDNKIALSDVHIPASQALDLSWGTGDDQVGRTPPGSDLSDGPRSFIYDAANEQVVVVDTLNDRLLVSKLAGRMSASEPIPDAKQDLSDIVGTTPGGPLLATSFYSVTDPTTHQHHIRVTIFSIATDGTSTQLIDGEVPFNTPENLRLVYDTAADMLWADIGNGTLYSMAEHLLAGTPTYVPQKITRPWITSAPTPAGFALQYDNATLPVAAAGTVLNILDIDVSADGRLWFLVGRDAPPGTSDVQLACLDLPRRRAQETPIAWPPPNSTFIRSMRESDDVALVYSGGDNGVTFSQYPASVCPSS